MTADPTQQVFWLASRAFGIVAIIMLAISVGLGLAMSGRIIHRPGLPAKLKRYHEASTLVTLGLITAHAGVLLADSYLRPGIAGITLPFQMSYRPLWTGIGIIAAWLTAILGPSFYARKWIGVKTWRWLHRWIIAAYFLALAHVVGAGTDGRSKPSSAFTRDWSSITNHTRPVGERRLPTASMSVVPGGTAGPSGRGRLRR